MTTTNRLFTLGIYLDNTIDCSSQAQVVEPNWQAPLEELLDALDPFQRCTDGFHTLMYSGYATVFGDSVNAAGRAQAMIPDWSASW